MAKEKFIHIKEMPLRKPVTEQELLETGRAEVVELEVETRAPEQWAEARGMLPQLLPAGAGAISTRANPDYWKFAATRAFKNWQHDQQLTEAEFDRAVLEMLGLRHGG